MRSSRANIVLRTFAACLSLLTAALTLDSCARSTASDLESEIARIRAIDNHAHPVRVVGGGGQDREFDALPVDNMEPESDPVYFRPGAPGTLDAWRALFGFPHGDLTPEHAHDARARKQQLMRDKGDSYPAWVLDQMGVEVMLANRVSMGRSIQPPRFRWVPYADALLFPLNNSSLASKNSDRKAFFADEDLLLHRYLADNGLSAPPADLDNYLTRVVTPTLERHKQGGALAEKFEAAYLRTLEFDPADRAAAAGIYARFEAKSAPPDDQYKLLQDYLFRYIAAECGRLGMAVHLHTFGGVGRYFDVRGADPLNLQSVLNDPALRKTNFVLVHGGWPFTREITPLLSKTNAYLDYSAQSLLIPSATLSQTLREWLAWVPEKVMFGTDAYPFSEDVGWEESGWIAAQRGRRALTLALTAMMQDGEISRARALELANLVLRDNARKLYGL